MTISSLIYNLSGQSQIHVADKFLKVMCDYCAEGLWTRSGAISPYSLPISDELKEKFIAWNWWYDVGYDPRKEEFDIDEFVAEGLELARKLKMELPDWTIYYFDEAECDRAFEKEQETGEKSDSNKHYYEVNIKCPKDG